MLLFAGNIVLELSKDKHNASLLDRQLVQFQSSVNRVESELSGQIRYLTQVNYTVTMSFFLFVHSRSEDHCYNHITLVSHGTSIVSSKYLVLFTAYWLS